MNYENWISYRYLIAGKGRFLTFLNYISIAGVALGVMALIVVTGVMTGFGNNLREKIIGTTPHIVFEKETGIRDFDEVQKQLLSIEGVKGASAYIQGNVFLEDSDRALGLVLRGVLPESEKHVTKVDQYLQKGHLKDLNGDGILIGSELARYFGYKIGDTITLISPGSGVSGKGWRYSLVISGIFKTGMADYDMSLVIVHLQKAQEIFNLSDNLSSGIGIKLENPYKAKEVKQKIHDTFV